MRICVVHGSPRKGNTYKAVEIFKEELRKKGEVEFTEFLLPKDMPKFCCGCFLCFEKGEEKCPHAQYVQPIAGAMREADGLIFSSPVYVLAESGAVKALLDHFGYIFIPHRPMEEMFSKVAMVISTTAGAGTNHSTKTVARSLRYWGVKRIYKYGCALNAKEWHEMKPQRREKVEGEIRGKANQFYKAVEKRGQLSTPIFTRIIFRLMRGMLGGYADGQTDKEYWREKGWLDGKCKPF